MNQGTVKKKSTLVAWLSGAAGMSKKKAKELVDARNVFVNDRRVWIGSFELKTGDRVEWLAPAAKTSGKKKGGNDRAEQARSGLAENAPDITVLYEDEWIVALNKPAGIVSDEGPRSLEAWLRKSRNDGAICAIHRLDKDTSGVILFARAQEVLDRFKELWQEREVEKDYYALCHNEADFSKMTVDRPLDGKNAVSHVSVVAKSGGFSLFKVQIETGRKYQIRRHLSAIGYPVAGDRELGKKVLRGPLDKSIRRQMLHATRIAFQHPFFNAPVEIEAALPGDFVSLLKTLGMAG